MSRKLRQRPRISYHEIEEPDLDEYVFCDECRDLVYEYCAIHGPLLVIPDDKVPSPTGFSDFVPHAALTIPQEFLHLAPSNIPGAGIGVFSTLTLPKGVRFGPYRGVRTKNVESEYCWQIYSSHTGGRKPLHAVDASDAARSNWMRYVNCSRHNIEQNLVAYQYQGELYYRTIKLIPRFSELLVFYGSEYARSLRIDMRLYNRVEGLERLIGPPVPEKPKLINGDSDKKQSTAENQANTEYETLNSSVTNDVENVPPKETCKGIPCVNDKQEQPEFKNIPNLPQNSNTAVPNNSNAEIKKDQPNKIQGNFSVTKAHSCNICDYKTNKKNVLQTHLKAHSASTKFTCDVCSYIATTRCVIVDHLNTHIGKKAYVCDICDKKFSHSVSLARHKIIHSGIKPYVCDICDKKFSHSSHLTTHIRIHSGIKPYVCDICEKKFSQSSALTRHKRIHSGIKPYVCDICDKKFSDSIHLTRHKRIHSGIKPYVCDICDKKFSDSSHLTTHMRIHSGIKPYVCVICNKKFSQSSALTTHMRIHSGIKPYVCDICDKKFSDSSHLTRHKRIHSGIKPYVCDICDKKFSDSSHLTTHMRIHSGIKPYVCDICDKKFSQSSSLTIHKRIHSGIKPLCM